MVQVKKAVGGDVLQPVDVRLHDAWLRLHAVAFDDVVEANGRLSIDRPRKDARRSSRSTRRERERLPLIQRRAALGDHTSDQAFGPLGHGEKNSVRCTGRMAHVRDALGIAIEVLGIDGYPCQCQDLIV